MNDIHNTAVVSPKAKLGDNIKIGAFAIIEDDVEIGNDCTVGHHAALYNGARIGNNVKIFQGCSVANLPQDLKFEDDNTLFYIGDNTTVREFCTLHKGTQDRRLSRVGSNCLLMAYVHVAHDCLVGDNCIIANSVQIGGHVTIEDWAIIGGGTPIHQFSEVGQHCMVGGAFRVVTNVPPYVLTAGEPLKFAGLNVIGLRRRGFSNDDIVALKEAYKLFYQSGLNHSQALERMEKEFEGNKYVANVIDFIKRSKRPLIKG